MRTKTAENIIKYLRAQRAVSPKDLAEHFGISRQALFKHLAGLLAEGKIYKVGAAPQVVYRIRQQDVVKETGQVYGEHKSETEHKEQSTLPGFLKPNFWFVEFNNLDKQRDKKFIIFQILNHGGLEDWKWLFVNYSKKEIQEQVKNSLATAWFKQSLDLWQGLLNVKAKLSRFSDGPVPVGPWGRK